MSDCLKNVKFKIISPIVTKARPKARVVNGQYAQMYTPKKTSVYENFIKLNYQEKVNYFFDERPLEVAIVAYFKCPNALKKYIPFDIKCVNHKDLDNIAKTILDALNGIAYKDDKQVQKLHVTKKYSETDYDYVEVSISDVVGTLEEVKQMYEYEKLTQEISKLESKGTLNAKDKERLIKLKEKTNSFSTPLPF